MGYTKRKVNLYLYHLTNYFPPLIPLLSASNSLLSLCLFFPDLYFHCIIDATSLLFSVYFILVKKYLLAIYCSNNVTVLENVYSFQKIVINIDFYLEDLLLSTLTSPHNVLF